MKIFSGNSNKPLALKIAEKMGEKLSPAEVFVFPDGEKRIRIEEKVLGEDTLLIQSTSAPPDENYMELFLLIDGLKRSGAKSVKVMLPYMGYQRQDHIFRDGEAVSLEVIAEILQRVGMSEFYSFDLHTPKITEIFSVPAHHLSALSLFADKIKKEFNLSKIVLVSPDMGGIRRIKEMSEYLGKAPFATIVKNRDLNTGNINDSEYAGDVRGKIALMVDDMISTGITMIDACNLLLKNGAEKVFAFATHAILAGNASANLQKSKIERVYVCDTINISKEKQFSKMEILSVAEIAAKALRA